MRNPKLLWPAFVLVILAQLLVPGKMVWDKEMVRIAGTEYKFRTAPFDPRDPFRGKYIDLSYTDTAIEVENTWLWGPDDVVYLEFSTDPDGFAQIESYSKTIPTGTRDYLLAHVEYVRGRDSIVEIRYPFDRLYLEESKAEAAEMAYRSALQNGDQTTYARVAIRDGDAVLQDVFIDDVSIREAAANWVED
ncbi:MAG: GDYXXLXY domain-containing protein [Bacteroidota bacterium]